MRSRSLYAITFILAACSILYELLIAHTISLLAANTVVWYSITIGLYLGAMGFGSFFTPKQNSPERLGASLVRVELLLVFFGFSAIPLIHFAQSLHTTALLQGLTVIATVVFPLVALSIIAIIGFLSGRELPLLIHLGNVYSKKPVTNRVLAADYIGSLIGAVLLPLLLLPHANNFLIATGIAATNLLVAIYVFGMYYQSLAWQKVTVGATSALATLLLLAALTNEHIEQFFLKQYYYYHVGGGGVWSSQSISRTLPDVARTHSPYQAIDLVTMLEPEYDKELLTAYSTKYLDNPWYPKNHILFINGDFQVFSDIDEIYHEWFAHVPIVLQGATPERVLVLGGGDGILHKELLKYPDIASITHIDIDPGIIHLAKYDPILRSMNEDALWDPRVRVRVADAYQYVRTTTERFDAIYIDFPYAQDYNIARLFSREFYQFVGDLLNPGGYIVLDAPDSGFAPIVNSYGERIWEEGEGWLSYYHTLRAAGYETIIPYSSILEEDNESAYDALRNKQYTFVDETSGLQADVQEENAQDLREAYAQEAIEIFTSVTSQGFIIIRKDRQVRPDELVMPDITLHALNKERLELSTDLPYSFPSVVDWTLVNSIFKPVIHSPSYMVKRPY